MTSREMGDGDGLFQDVDGAPPPPLNGHVTKEMEMTDISPLEELETGAVSSSSPVALKPVEFDDDEAVGESLPSPEEIRATVNPRSKSSRPAFSGKGNGTIVFFFCSLLVILILSVGLGVGLSNRDEANQARKSSSEGIQDYVVARGLSPSSAFASSSSPQSRAVEWMARDDRLNFATPDSSLDINTNDQTYQFALRYIMTVVYYSTGGGTSWRYSFNFLSDRPTCDWNGALRTTSGTIRFGLICFNDNAYALFLDNLNALGAVPEELGVLTTLVTVDFNFNGFLGGTIPQSICALTNLRQLSMGFTDVGGSLPSCINQLSNLELLFFPNTKLSGPLPNMRNMVSLEKIFLDDNDLSGDISTAFDSMTELRYVYLEDNKFTGTVDDSFMTQNPNLRQLDISNNPLEGSVPPHLFQLPDLQLIDFHGIEGIGGSFPQIPQRNFAMFFIALQDCSIEGPLPTTMGNLPNVYYLDLTNNTLNGDIPTEIGAMTKLRNLFLSDNEGFVPGPIPETFKDLTQLKEFSLKGTNRDGNLPDFISTFGSLILLDLSSNDMNGFLPSSYGDLVNLEFMLLNGNVFNGEVPTSYAKLTKLRGMFLEDNILTGNLTHMCALDTFKEPANDVDGTELLVADCDGGFIDCDCCICCEPNSDADVNPTCNDNDLTPNMDPEWESRYDRVAFNFGNDTRFIDKKYVS